MELAREVDEDLRAAAEGLEKSGDNDRPARAILQPGKSAPAVERDQRFEILPSGAEKQEATLPGDRGAVKPDPDEPAEVRAGCGGGDGFRFRAVPEAPPRPLGVGLSLPEAGPVIRAKRIFQEGISVAIMDDELVEQRAGFGQDEGENSSIVIEARLVVFQTDAPSAEMEVSEPPGQKSPERGIFPFVVELGRIDADQPHAPFSAVGQPDPESVAVGDPGHDSGVGRLLWARASR